MRLGWNARAAIGGVREEKEMQSAHVKEPHMKKLIHIIAKIGSCLQSPVLLLIRLAWGWELAESGWGHLHHINDTAKFFADLHIPYPVANVYLSGSVELIGGILLILGLFARPISVPILFNFFVAYVTDGIGPIKELLHFKNPDHFIDYTAFPFVITSLLMLAFGPGKISLDFVIEKICGKKSGASEKPGGT